MKSTLTYIVLSIVLFSACKQTNKNNTLTPSEEKDGWQLLFNGKDLNNWHIYNQGNQPSKWVVKDEEILCDPTVKTGIFGDLISNETYQDFELKYDWKVAKGGNSGVFIDVQEDKKYDATFVTGLEMQLLDNGNAESRHQADSTHWAGCLYAVKCIGSNSKPKPFNEWNESRIVQNKGKVSFWLNGQLTFENVINTEEWKNLIAKTNMKNYPDFGLFQTGKIALQNHTDAVSFRNIKIKVL
ncbi:DUF1080 domain-containing protein [Sphingobacterium sp. SRCM116780]|uniref:3-keto-disaccharide hydrolase n=1 Tax=Sphingobacterium sp. SRCM116780 TaxID=2907623 RepID=UPI001F17D8DC|nr:DUF1080 domain-containing protein [Sphingobacterium sp. SRCM116780]UIR56099.1 DUF1080 domain-containing protein [Sphingobacterium sp. SRCM116780]